MRPGPLNRRSERWIASWPSTMARGPRRFVATRAALMFVFMALIYLSLNWLWSDAPMTGNVLIRTALMSAVWMVPMSLWLGFVQWRECNRVYAERTGDATAQAWADRVVDLTGWVWMVVLIGAAFGATTLAAWMAWTSGAPALWAVALFCAIVGLVTLRSTVQTLRRTA